MTENVQRKNAVLEKILKGLLAVSATFLPLKFGTFWRSGRTFLRQFQLLDADAHSAIPRGHATSRRRLAFPGVGFLSDRKRSEQKRRS